jgi:hypothetical protein
MCIRVKQYGANMRLRVVIVLKPFLNFMDSFKLFKTHNMLALMIDPRFKDLNLVGNYVGQASTTEIASAYDTHFLLPTFKALF